MIIITEQNHDRLTGLICECLALEYGFPEREAARLKFAANLHDIGKIEIPSAILDKPGKLTPDEFETVKLHTVYGYNLLQSMRGDSAKLAQTIAMLHHERYDGKGYWGVARENQSVHIAIVSIADVFTALISVRSYKKAWTIDEALNYITNNAGTQFDPHIVGLFTTFVRGGGVSTA